MPAGAASCANQRIFQVKASINVNEEPKQELDEREADAEVDSQVDVYFETSPYLCYL
jgi:hypothetical protein